MGYILFIGGFAVGALLGTLLFAYVYELLKKEHGSNALVLVIVFGAISIAGAAVSLKFFKGMIYPYIFGVTFGFSVNYKGKKETPSEDSKQ